MSPQESFDPGLTQQFGGKLRRFIEKDGAFNVERRGVEWRDTNPYLLLIRMSWRRFMTVLLVGYLLTNLVFAELYVLAGPDNLLGAGDASLGRFGSAFFFSVHTLTTVGYGNLAPRGLLTNLLAAVEAMIGLLGFALATGLLFGRVSRPSARIVFSENIIVAPYRERMSLQFRIANRRENNLMELEAKMLLMTVDVVDGQTKRAYHDLPLERGSVYFFPLSWTVVHPINEASPIFGKSAADLARLQAEVLVVIKGFDDTFSQTVHTRYSYRHDEIVWQARFRPAFYFSDTGDLVLELGQLNEFERL